MKSSASEELRGLYEDLEARFSLKTGSSALAGATQFHSNAQRAIHRWFRFKEGFSADLMTAAAINMDPLAEPGGVFLDPFCGSGTTLLAGDIQHGWRARRIGLEINPFLAFVAATKVNWRAYDSRRLKTAVSELLLEPLCRDIPPEDWPELSTFHNPDVFSPHVLSSLLDATKRIKALSTPEADLMLLGVASAAERMGFFRKDGRALRILRDSGQLAERKLLRPESVLEEVWLAYLKDLEDVQAMTRTPESIWRVLEEDGRLASINPELCIEPGEVSVIAYSPPYFNHIDYTEVYKIELWLLGFVKTYAEMVELRRRTLRSHASIVFAATGEDLPDSVSSILNIAATEIEAAGTKWHSRFRDTANAYFEDMQEALRHQYELLRVGGEVVCVVGNSAHGSGKHRIPIASDLLIAVLAEAIGFEIKKLTVARQMRRRDTMNRFLRETVLVFARR